jgi:hypothetical protein
MPSKSWFVQIYPAGGKPKAPMVFTDPEKVCTFIEELKKRGLADTVTVYLPESATNEEQQGFDELGVKISYLS